MTPQERRDKAIGLVMLIFASGLFWRLVWLGLQR